MVWSVLLYTHTTYTMLIAQQTAKDFFIFILFTNLKVNDTSCFLTGSSYI